MSRFAERQILVNVYSSNWSAGYKANIKYDYFTNSFGRWGLELTWSKGKTSAACTLAFKSLASERFLEVFGKSLL